MRSSTTTTTTGEHCHRLVMAHHWPPLYLRTAETRFPLKGHNEEAVGLIHTWMRRHAVYVPLFTDCGCEEPPRV